MTTMEMNVKLSKLNDPISQSNERMGTGTWTRFQIRKKLFESRRKKKVSLCVTS